MNITGPVSMTSFQNFFKADLVNSCGCNHDALRIAHLIQQQKVNFKCDTVFVSGITSTPVDVNTGIVYSLRSCQQLPLVRFFSSVDIVSCLVFYHTGSTLSAALSFRSVSVGGCTIFFHTFFFLSSPYHPIARSV